MYTPLRLEMYGLNTSHDRGFVVDRPAPRTVWLVLCFHTPVSIRTARGQEIGAIGDCIVQDPGFPEWHTTAPNDLEGFRNDWLHIADEGMADRIGRYGLPLNQLIPTGLGSYLTDCMQAIEREEHRREAFWEESIAAEIEKVLARIGRAHKAHGVRLNWSAAKLAHFDRLSELRFEMMARCGEPWNIEDLANLARLSPNRFAVLYSRFFGGSPIDDLINFRLRRACRHLLHSGATMEAIARECGFVDAAYFSRTFKRRMGCPPSMYRSMQL